MCVFGEWVFCECVFGASPSDTPTGSERIWSRDWAHTRRYLRIHMCNFLTHAINFKKRTLLSFLVKKRLWTNGHCLVCLVCLACQANSRCAECCLTRETANNAFTGQNSLDSVESLRSCLPCNKQYLCLMIFAQLDQGNLRIQKNLSASIRIGRQIKPNPNSPRFVGFIWPS